MSKLVTVIGLTLLMAAPAWADIVISSSALNSMAIVAHPTGHSYYTGPINVQTTDSLGVYSAMATFDTFCVEVNEHISVPGRYDVTNVSTAAYMGGYTGGNPDPLSQQTAWIYRNYLAGTLDDYASDYTQSDKNDRAAVQMAVWWLEGEWVNSSMATVALTNALAAALCTAAQTHSTANDLNYVRVMNLDADGPSTAVAQSLLVSVPYNPGPPPVPAPGAALLIGVGLSCIGWFKRRSA